MKQHKFTVIIPTRERADTLYWTLKTCVMQDYQNLEILVSDNFSQDNTKEVVDSFDDKRIRYINTGKRLSMSLNWEFALSHVNDGKVMFLGDDDGLLSNGLIRINNLFNELKCEHLAWGIAQYSWTNLEEGYPGQIEIPTYNTIKKLNASKIVQKIYNKELHYFSLLGFYGRGFVDISLIKKITAKYNDRFFVSSIPDVYAALIITRHVDHYWFSDYPLAISGGSKKSNTGSATSQNNSKEYTKFLSESYEEKYHSNLEMLPGIITLPIGDGLLYGASEPDGSIDPIVKEKILEYIFELSITYNQYRNPTDYEYNIQRLMVMAQKNGMEIFFKALLLKSTNKYTKQDLILPNKSGIFEDQKKIYIDGKILNINNIYDASLLVSQILGIGNPDKKLNAYEPSLMHRGAYLSKRFVEESIKSYFYKLL